MLIWRNLCICSVPPGNGDWHLAGKSPAFKHEPNPGQKYKQTLKWNYTNLFESKILGWLYWWQCRHRHSCTWREALRERRPRTRCRRSPRPFSRGNISRQPGRTKPWWEWGKLRRAETGTLSGIPSAWVAAWLRLYPSSLCLIQDEAGFGLKKALGPLLTTLVLSVFACLVFFPNEWRHETSESKNKIWKFFGFHSDPLAWGSYYRASLQWAMIKRPLSQLSSQLSCPSSNP